jgi:hypothetical protein
MGEPAEDPRNWRGLYKAALFETDTSKLPWRFEGARKALIFRSRRYLKLPPIMTAKLRLSRMPSMPC